jgi:hypothetical protein
MSRRFFLGVFILAAGVFLFNSSAHAATNEYWVSPTGSDSNSGTQTNPWKTIQHADASLTLGTNGTVVHVLPGTYSGPELALNHSGHRQPEDCLAVRY